ncbi:14199_t:CDS:2 [Rhizophagus irregularis]|nr:14199_t:CDS:2 [Rhizophagus irregularis]
MFKKRSESSESSGKTPKKPTEKSTEKLSNSSDTLSKMGEIAVEVGGAAAGMVDTLKNNLPSGSTTQAFFKTAGDIAEAVTPFLPLVGLVDQLDKDLAILHEDMIEMNKFLHKIEGGITVTVDNTETIMNKLEIQNNEIKIIVENVIEQNKRLIEMNEKLDEDRDKTIKFTSLNRVIDTISLLNKQVNEQDSTVVVTAKDIKASELQDPLRYVKPRQGSRVKIQKKIYNALEVACKPISVDNIQKTKKHLAILEKLDACPYIIKFHGLSEIATEKVMVFEWAELGNLKDVYQQFKIDWEAKITITRDICRGLAFLQSGKRETLNFGLSPHPIQREFGEIIKLAWQQDPSLRPGIQLLFNMLQESYEKNVLSNKGSPLIRPLKENTTEITTGDADLDSLCLSDSEDQNESVIQIVVPLIPVKEGLQAHKEGNHKKAWECFEANANVGDILAIYWQGYYYLEGKYVDKNKQKAMDLFRKAADAGNADAQLRYAFCLIDKENKNIDSSKFMKYLQLAADNNNATALYNLGDVYFSGKLGIKKDKEKGIHYLKQAALHKQAKAKEILDKYDTTGKIVLTNPGSIWQLKETTVKGIYQINPATSPNQFVQDNGKGQALTYNNNANAQQSQYFRIDTTPVLGGKEFTIQSALTSGFASTIVGSPFVLDSTVPQSWRRNTYIASISLESDEKVPGTDIILTAMSNHQSAKTS